MNISKGDLVKSKGTWAIVGRVDSELKVVDCFLLTVGNPHRIWVYEEIAKVVYEEPTGQFLNVLSQQEKIEYIRYYADKAQDRLRGVENSLNLFDTTGKDLDKLAKIQGITRTTQPLKYRVEEGILHPKEINTSLSDDPDETVKQVLTRRDTSGGWSKNEELFDPFDDQTPYPLDFDNFVYGDVEQCYDEERDYLVIKCVDDFIEHMMTR